MKESTRLFNAAMEKYLSVAEIKEITDHLKTNEDVQSVECWEAHHKCKTLGPCTDIKVKCTSGKEFAISRLNKKQLKISTMTINFDK